MIVCDTKLQRHRLRDRQWKTLPRLWLFQGMESAECVNRVWSCRHFQPPDRDRQAPEVLRPRPVPKNRLHSGWGMEAGDLSMRLPVGSILLSAAAEQGEHAETAQQCGGRRLGNGGGDRQRLRHRKDAVGNRVIIVPGGSIGPVWKE